MKVPIKSALSVALALAASQAFALGLGPIQIKSGLNQPLLAEIPVVADSAAEVEDLRVDLASAEDFQRVGLSRTRVTVPIEFSVASNSRGQKVIRLTTKDAVREPFLDFLIEASWSKGKLLREYTVLLDPPVSAPAVPTTAIAAKAAEKPKPTEAAPRTPVSQPRPAETPKAVAQAAPAAPSPAPTAAAAAASRAGEYTVQRGDTLSQIAHEHGDDPRDFNRMLVALYKANPDAFYGANMNALKTGAVMRIPTAEEVRTAGSLREAAAAVRAQFQSWQGGGAATLVANTGAAPAADKTGQPAPAQANTSERVTLVPPSGAGGETGAGRGGSGAGGSKDSTALRADLARTKEALTSREQEAGELKSRVSQLEDINNKSQRLLSLKDSEIAELQNKLKQLEATKGGAKPSETATTAHAPTPAAPANAAAPAPAPAAASTPTPAAAPAPTPAAPAAAANAPASSPAAPPSVAATPAPAPAPATPPAAQPPASAQPAPAATPAATAPAPAVASTPAAAKPPVAAAPKPAAPPVKPVTTAKPWYADYIGDNPYALYGAGGILVLIAGWLATRAFGGGGKKKVNPRPTPAAVAPAVAEETLGEDEQEQLEKDAERYYEGAEATGSQQPQHVAATQEEDDDEMEQLRRHFDDGNADRFVALAHSLHEKLPEDSDEWREIAALGRQLLPGSPLFAESSAAAHDGHSPDEFFFDDEPGAKHEAVAHEADNGHDDRIKTMLDDDAPLAFEPHGGHEAESNNDLPDLDFEREFGKHIDEEPIELAKDEEPAERHHSLLDEDTIGTRLDLARAYLDMGDPEGARSMLDEVLAEGNATQKEEARKLLAEIS